MKKPTTAEPKIEHGFSTKYALTTGIAKVKVTAGTADLRFVYTVPGLHGFRVQLIRNNTFWTTKEAAERRAIQMAEAKIKSLKRQLEELERDIDCPKWAK